MPSKKGLFLFVFHIFHKSLSAGLEGRNLSKSSITEVFEVNVKFVAT